MLSEAQIISMGIQIAEALMYRHSRTCYIKT